MPTSKWFQQVPPFPANTPYANIPTLSLSQLESGSPQEGNKLFQACRQHGFFMLDLRNSPLGPALIERAATMYDLTNETMDMDREYLAQFAYKPPGDLAGYKSAGIQKTPDGPDTIAMYSMSRDDLLGLEPRPNPSAIESRRPESRDFIRRAHSVVDVVLATLDAQLGIPSGTLSELCSPDRPSATTLRLLRSLPQQQDAATSRPLVTGGAHTDIGVITLLFHVAGGLQLLPSESENTDAEWRYVRPQQGCVLVNVGDTLVEWTGGLFKSALHRVVTSPGEQCKVRRISLAYLIRPAREETMRRLRGGDKIALSSAEGEEDTRPVEVWAAERTDQAIRGILRPRTHGGEPIATY